MFGLSFIRIDQLNADLGYLFNPRSHLSVVGVDNMVDAGNSVFQLLET